MYCTVLTCSILHLCSNQQPVHNVLLPTINRKNLQGYSAPFQDSTFSRNNQFSHYLVEVNTFTLIDLCDGDVMLRRNGEATLHEKQEIRDRRARGDSPPKKNSPTDQQGCQETCRFWSEHILSDLCMCVGGGGGGGVGVAVTQNKNCSEIDTTVNPTPTVSPPLLVH